jgi:hypothetical protein
LKKLDTELLEGIVSYDNNYYGMFKVEAEKILEERKQKKEIKNEIDPYKLIYSVIPFLEYSTINIEFEYNLQIVLIYDKSKFILSILDKETDKEIELFYKNKEPFYKCITSFLDEHVLKSIELSGKKGSTLLYKKN